MRRLSRISNSGSKRRPSDAHLWTCSARQCLNHWLLYEKQYTIDVPPEFSDYGIDDGEIEESIEDDDILEQREPVLVDRDQERSFPVCKHTVIPAVEGNTTNNEDEAIFVVKAKWILKYFEDPEHGTERHERLNDGATIGTELTAAHDFAKWHYRTALKHKRTAAVCARAERRAAQDDSSDSKNVPRKKTKRSKTRREDVEDSKQSNESTGCGRKPGPKIIDLTKDSEEDEEMSDVSSRDGVGAKTSVLAAIAHSEGIPKQHATMKVSSHRKPGQYKHIRRIRMKLR